MSKEKMIAITAIKEEIFVRRDLSMDRVQYLEELIEAGEQLTPMLVTEKTVTLVDGRHRLLAYRNLGYETVRVEVMPELPRGELIVIATNKNVEGKPPLAPTKKDLYFACTQLVRLGWSDKKIHDALDGFHPKASVDKYLHWSHTNIRKELAREAVRLIRTEGLTMKAAAARVKVDISEVKDYLKGREDADDKLQIITQKLAHLKSSFSNSAVAIQLQVLELQRDTVIDKSQALKVNHSIKQFLKAALRTADSYTQRILSEPD